ncbi:MAG: SIMPL domain-containing protein [Patescibacteria group bacterium]|jgi:hypothetical protein
MSGSKYFFILKFGLVLIAGVLIFGLIYQAVSSRSYDKNVLSAIGSAEARIISDNAHLTINISRAGSLVNLTKAYKLLDQDLNLLKNFLRKNGLTDYKITVNPTSIKEELIKGNRKTGVELNRLVEISSERAEKIKEISEIVSALSSSEVVFSVDSAEYYYNGDWPYEQLLKEAADDAREQAVAKAAVRGRHLGEFRKVLGGSEKILPADLPKIIYGNYDQDYYDDSTPEKDIMVTVKLLFAYE